MSASQLNSTIVATPQAASSVDQAGFSNNTTAVAFGLPGNAGLVSLGASYVIRTATASATAGVAAYPTTASHFSLQNRNPLGSTLQYVILSVSFDTITSNGATTTAHLIVHNGITPTATAITGTAALGPFSLSGKTSVGTALGLSTVTITNDAAWHPIGQSYFAAANTTTVALGGEAVTSDYIIRPGCIFSCAVLESQHTSSAYVITVKYAEVPLILG